MEPEVLVTKTADIDPQFLYSVEFSSILEFSSCRKLLNNLYGPSWEYGGVHFKNDPNIHWATRYVYTRRRWKFLLRGEEELMTLKLLAGEHIVAESTLMDQTHDGK